MPFRSESQRKWMYANEPEMAERWEKHTPKKKLPERVGKMSEASASFFSFHFPKTFSLDQAKAWMKKRGYRVARASEDPKKRKGVVIWTGSEANGFTLKQVKLADGVVGMRDGFDEAVGKMSVQGASGGGAVPALVDSALPDFKTIYYQPTDPETEKREMEEQRVRRRALARMNSGKFGLHGATTPEPQVQYHPGDYPAVTRGQANEPAGRAPKLIVRDQNMRPPKRKDPTP